MDVQDKKRHAFSAGKRKTKEEAIPSIYVGQGLSSWVFG
jgi:hypothetical protein